MKIYCQITPVLLVGLITACGHTKTDRSLSGAGVGAAVGAAGAAVAGGVVGTGAVVGAAVGAAAGAITEEEDIDLGEPAWK